MNNQGGDHTNTKSLKQFKVVLNMLFIIIYKYSTLIILKEKNIP